jgi:uncharacterized protein (TIGR00299 family) protein
MNLARLHLDPVGGIAGDMFVAALCDAFPEHVPGMLAELAKLSSPGGKGRVELRPHSDGILQGRRFHVEDPPSDTHARSSRDHGDGQAHNHMHVPHREIRATLLTAGLDPATLKHALALFELLAEAEGAVHGIGPEDVAFHEVGAWDSIVDFVGAAYLIATIAPRSWSVGALPLGGGRVKTEHGILPLPAPATTWLLRGRELVDDGVGGERVTPTGATIVRYLCPEDRHPGEGRGPISRAPITIVSTGQGFGTMKLRGMPNVLRVLAFADSPALPQPLGEEIATLEFEVDDQSAEDLAVGLDRIRATAGVLDASQAPVVGKKGRLATRVQVLAQLDAADAVADLCLAQTTTLGVRISRVMRRVAPRASVETADGVRVKLASRPTGEMTAKAEMDDLARVPGGRAERQEARKRAEDEALRTTTPHGRGKRD